MLLIIKYPMYPKSVMPMISRQGCLSKKELFAFTLKQYQTIGNLSNEI